MENYLSNSTCEVNISCDVNTSGTISIPGQGFSANFNVLANQTTTLNLATLFGTFPNNISNLGSEIIANKGILIETQENVFVSAVNRRTATTDATLIFPANSLGSDYIITSYRGLGFASLSSEFLIVATQDGTTIDITPSTTTSAGNPAGVTFQITLDEGESYQVQALNDAADFTATTIVGTGTNATCRSFAVFSGAKCTNVPNWCRYCDHLYEMNLPTNIWGTNYFTIPFNSTDQYTYKILAKDNGTTYSVDGVAQPTLNAGQFAEFNSGAVPHCISSNNPITVSQFMNGRDCAALLEGDPSMMILRPEYLKFTETIFATSTDTLRIDSDFVHIITETVNTSLIFLDGVNIPSSNFSVFPNCNNYSHARMFIDKGSHKANSTAEFSAYCYGGGGSESYAYAVGSGSDVTALTVDAGMDQSFCQGNSAVIGGSPTASGGSGNYTYFWGPATGLNSTSVANPIASPSSTQTYTVTVTDGNGCSANGITDEVTVNVSLVPTVDAGNNLTICGGGNGVVIGGNPTASNGNGAYTYEWSPSIGLSATNVANPIASPTSTQTYTVTVKSGNGCAWVTDDIVVTTGGIAPNANAGINQSPCEGGWAQLGSTPTASGGSGGPYTYAWGPALGLTSTTAERPWVQPTDTQTYTVTVTASDGCTTTDDVTVSVRLVPDVNAGADQNICLGGDGVTIGGSPTAFNGNGAYTYEWSPATGLNSSTVANPHANPTSTQSYTLTVRSGNGCAWAFDTVTVNVNFISPVVDAGSTQTPCEGGWAQIGGSPTASGGTAPYTYAWSPSIGLTSTTVDRPWTQLTSSQTYTVTLTDANGCSVTDSVDVAVRLVPDVDGGPDHDFCEGVFGILGGAPTAFNGNGAYTYEWSPSTGLSSTTSSNPVAAPTSTQSYTLTVKSGNGCAWVFDTVTVTVRPAPTIDAGPDKSFCAGSGGVVLDGSVSGTGTTPPYTYQWTPTNNLSNANIPNPTATPLATTTYTLLAWDNRGCSGEASEVVVTVNPNPIVDAGSNICSTPGGNVIGGSPTASAGSGGGYTYAWSSSTIPSGLSSTTAANPTVSFSEFNRTYTVIVTDGNGCTATDTVTVYAGITPNPVFHHSDPICPGSGGSIISQGSIGGVPPMTYNWSPSTGLSSTTIYNPVANPPSTQSYSVTITDQNGCSATNSTTVNVNNLAVNAGPNVCSTPGGVIIGDAPTASAGSGPYTYLWSPSFGLNSTAIANPTASPPSVNLIYTVTVTDGDGCTAVDNATVLTSPTVDAGNNQSFCAGSGGVTIGGTPTASDIYSPYTYSWSPATGLSSTTIANPTATPSSSQTYTVTVTNANGCTNTDNVTITVNNIIAADAGPNQSECAFGNFTLAGNNPSPGTGLWTLVSGTANIFNATSPNATVNGVSATTVLRWTITNGTCVSSDDVTLTNDANVTANAGPNQSACAFGNFTLAGNDPSPGTGLWTLVSGTANIFNATSPNATVSGVSATTVLRWTITNGACVSSSDVTLTNNSSITANAGPNQSACAFGNFTLAGNDPSPGTGLWTLVSGTANIFNATSPNATVSGVSATTVLRWTITNGACVSSSDVTLTNNSSITANAGPNQSACAFGNFTLAGNDPSPGTGLWTLVSGTANIFNATSPNATVNGVSATTVLRWTITNGACVSSSDVTLTNNSSITANAGPNQSACAFGNFTLAGNNPSPGTGLWTLVSGTANIFNATSPNATVNGVSATTVLRWTITNGACVSSSDVTLTNDVNKLAFAGSNQTKCNNGSFTMAGNDPAPYTGLWTLVSGTANITDNTSHTTTVTGVPAGTSAVLRWTITNGACVNSSDVTLTNDVSVTADAGPNQSECAFGNFTLAGNDPSPGTGLWTLVSGTANIFNATSPNATVNGVSATTVLRWTITNGACVSSSDVTLTNDANKLAFAGSNQTKCNNGTFTMTGNDPAPYTGLWTVVSGTANITDNTSHTTTVTGVPAGTSAVLRWTITNGACVNSSDVTLTNDVSVTADAGSNQDKCTVGSFTMAANSPAPGTGLWTLVSGTANILNSTSPTTGINGVPAGTSAVLRWTITNGSCVSSDEVTVTSDLNVVANAGPNQDKCTVGSFALAANSPAPGTGLWTLISGTANILSNTSPTTGINGVPAGDSAVLRWTITNGTCTTSDEVTIASDLNIVANAGPDQDKCNIGSFTLAANSPAPGTGLWTLISGTANILSNTSPTTGINGVPAGDSAVLRWTVNNGTCSTDDDVTITNHSAVTADAGSSASFCVDAGGVVIGGSPTASNGTGPYTYNWLPSSGLSASNVANPTANPTSSQTYTVTVNDANGCTGTDVVDVSLNIKPQGTIAEEQSINCYGENGALRADIFTGTPPFTFSWSSGTTDSIATGLLAGNYTLTVIDNNGCDTILSQTINQPDSFIVSTSKIDATCGVSNGQATVNASGASPPYTFLWSDPMSQTTATATGLIAGNYTVSVTDSLNCEKTVIVSVSNAAGGTANISVDSTITCHSSCNAQASVSMTGGTPPFTYSWSNSATDTFATNLCQGTVTVTVTDNSGCIATDNLIINQPDSMIVMINDSTNVSCSGLFADGEATVTVVSGGISPFTYSWAPYGGTNATATGLAATTFFVTVYDSSGCSDIDQVNITEPIPLSATISTHVNVSCFGGNDGLLVVNPAGGTPGYEYLWSNAQTGDSAKALVAGNYQVTVSDTNNCLTLASADITHPDSLNINFSLTNDNCGQNNGKIKAIVSGGTSPYSYIWSNAATTDSIDNLTTNRYFLTVTDSNGCQKIASDSIIDVCACITNIVIDNPISCFNVCDAQIAAMNAGGVPPFTYSWSNGATDSIINGVCQGSISVTVTDGIGCVAMDTITINQPDSIQLTLAKINTNCGQNDGQVSVSVTGGTNPYSFLWNNAATTDTVRNINAGTYVVTVTDNNGCTNADSIIVNDIGSGVLTILLDSPITCYGSCNAQASAIMTGGAAPYTYAWSNTATDTFATNLCQGTVTVTVTDNIGCVVIENITINQPDSLIAVILDSTNLTCGGAFSDGTAAVTVNGGTLPYTYTWTPYGGTDSTATGLTADNFTVVVIDNNGCSDSDYVVLTALPTLTASITNYQDVSCYNANDGSLTVTPGDSTPGYTYNWNNGQSDSTATGLGPGNYTVTVTDNSGCMAIAMDTITEPDSLTLTMDVVDANCGQADGEVSVSVTGGTNPYSFLWNNAATTDTVRNINAGTYVVTVTDNNGCTNADSIIVNDVGSGALTILLDSPITCYSSCNAQASAIMTGGTAPYTYAWSNTATDTFATNLCQGTVTVTVTDNIGCVVIENIAINQPDSLDIVLNTINDNCAQNNGKINAFVSGGTAPYSYNWSNAATTDSIDNLNSNRYFLTVTDSNGCQKIASDSIIDVCACLTNIVIDNPISCFNACDAQIAAMNAGGVPPFTYSWSNGATDSIINGVCQGSISVTVTDGIGCVAMDTITINQPDSIQLTLAKINTNCGQNDGEVSVSVTGGTNPYSFLWNNTATTDTVRNINAGTYVVTVTDNNGCTSADSIIVNDIGSGVLTILLDSSITCYGSCNAQASAIMTGGTAPYTYAWSNTATDTFATNLCQGTVTVTVTDNIGCVVIENITINQPDSLIAIILDSANLTCGGAFSDGTAAVTVNGGTLPYTYTWTPYGGTDSTATGLTADNFTVVVIDNNGCSDSDYVVLTALPTLTASITNHQDVSCYNANDGSLTVTPAGSTPSYTYNWNNGQSDSTATGLGPGNYTVTVTDNSGCMAIAMDTITEPDSLTLTMDVVDANCGQNDGEVSVAVTGGTNPYSFLWNNTATTDTVRNINAGTYVVTVTDNNGCTNADSIVVNDIAGGSLMIVLDAPITCHSSCNAQASAIMTGGIAPFTYNWSNAATDSFASSLCAGFVVVTVTDDIGCIVIDSLLINQPDSLVAIISDSINLSCGGGLSADGQATVSHTGGTAPYSYAWAPYGGTNATAENLVIGTYTVTVTDNNGCTDIDLVNITEPEVLTATISGQQNITCYGANDGTLTASGVGGTPSYTYTWSNGQNNSTATGLAPGTYVVTVTDNNSCITITNGTITQPDSLVASIQDSTNLLCGGPFSDGNATVTVNGGTAPFSYHWKPLGGDSSAATGLPAGTYTVLVTDTNGCADSDKVTLTAPPILTANFSVHQDVSCYGNNDGSLAVTPNGGTQPYTFNWQHGPTNDTIYNLSIGKYTVSITDNNGCAIVINDSIEQPDSLALTITTFHAKCFAEASGSAVINVIGGTPNYSFLWLNGQTSDSAFAMPADTNYKVIVTDGNNCVDSLFFDIQQPSQINISDSIINATCFGNCDGEIWVTPDGGIAPYTFAWNNSLTDDHIIALCQDTFFLTITDNNGCDTTIDFFVQQPLPFNPMIIAPDTICEGDTLIIVGTGNGDFLWENGDTNASRIIIASTKDTAFSLIVHNDFCADTAFHDINIRAIPQLNITGPTEVCQFDTLSLNAIGGYNNFVWDTGDSTRNITLQIDSHGIHQFIVASYGWCATVFDTAFVNVKPAPVFEAGPNITTYYGENIQLFVKPDTGTVVWKPADQLSCEECYDPSIQVFEPIQLFVTMTDDSGCTAFDTVNIDLFDGCEEPFVPSAFSPNGDGYNDVLFVKGKGYTEFLWTIFNRWGIQVYASNDQSEGWDGIMTAKDRNLQEDIFVYTLKLTCNDGNKIEITGNITMIR